MYQFPVTHLLVCDLSYSKVVDSFPLTLNYASRYIHEWHLYLIRSFRKRCVINSRHKMHSIPPCGYSSGGKYIMKVHSMKGIIQNVNP